MRYVAVVDGCWVGLVGFGSSALKVTVRDEMLGWSVEQRYQRLRYIANNQRFCVLPAGRRPNLASAVLSRVLKRVSDDYLSLRGHRIVAVETFTDPSRHRGTCYRAANFREVGATSGWSRSGGGSWTRNGVPKTYWFYPLCRNVPRLLASVFDPPELSRQDKTMIDLNTLGIDSDGGLIDHFADIADSRRGQGKRHSLCSVLSIAALATICGNRHLGAIAEFAADLGQDALQRLDGRWDPNENRYVAPSDATFRRVIAKIDGDEFDTAVGKWFYDQLDDSGTDGHGHTIAVDGKALRGARRPDGKRVHLLSAMDHHSRTVVAQTEVDKKTNEITRFEPLIDEIEDLEDVTVTADAMHTQRDHAKYLVDKRGANYLVGVKGNQPNLLAAAQSLPEEAFSP